MCQLYISQKSLSWGFSIYLCRKNPSQGQCYFLRIRVHKKTWTWFRILKSNQTLLHYFNKKINKADLLCKILPRTWVTEKCDIFFKYESKIFILFSFLKIKKNKKIRIRFHIITWICRPRRAVVRFQIHMPESSSRRAWHKYCNRFVRKERPLTTTTNTCMQSITSLSKFGMQILFCEENLAMNYWEKRMKKKGPSPNPPPPFIGCR